MDVFYRCCCGLDVHKDSVTACVLWPRRVARTGKRNASSERSPGSCWEGLCPGNWESAGKTAEQTNAQRQRLAAAPFVPIGMGGLDEAEQLSTGAIPPFGRTPRSEAAAHTQSPFALQYASISCRMVRRGDEKY
jgi:hypothetical protein